MQTIIPLWTDNIEAGTGLPHRSPGGGGPRRERFRRRFHRGTVHLPAYAGAGGTGGFLPPSGRFHRAGCPVWFQLRAVNSRNKKFPNRLVREFFRLRFVYSASPSSKVLTEAVPLRPALSARRYWRVVSPLEVTSATYTVFSSASMGNSSTMPFMGSALRSS